MKKNLTKEQLIENIYDLERKLYLMEECFKVQSETLERFAKLYSYNRSFLKCVFLFFIMPFKIRKAFKESDNYFYNLNTRYAMNLTKQQVVNVMQAINDYENKKISPQAYKRVAMDALGIKGACTSCTDVMKRLHNDTQKIIYMYASKNYPELVPPIEFKSSKFSVSGHYHKTVPLMCYDDMRKIYSYMKRDVEAFKNRGLLEQSNLIVGDMKILNDYCEFRLNGYVEPIEDPEDAEPIESEDTEEAKEEANFELENDPKVDALEENIPIESTPPQYNNEAAYKMKQEGMKIKEISEFFQVAPSTIRGRLKKYEEGLQDK